MTTTMAQRVATTHLAKASAKEEVLWASREIVKANRKLEDVYLVLTARGSGSSYEGNESLADGDSAVTAAVKDLQDASALLAKASDTLRTRSSAMSRLANETNALDGLDKRTGLRRINAVIAGAHLNGIFRDDHWLPIQKLLKKFTDEGIPAVVMTGDYTKDDKGRPTSKTWKFKVEWQDQRGRPVVAYGQIVASGAGSVDNPLDAYDVVAYAN